MNRLIQLHNYKGSLLAAILLLYLMKPYFVWHGLLGSNLIIIPASLLLGGLFFYNRDFKKNGLFLCALFIFICIIYTIIRGRNLNFLISIIPFSILPFGDRNFTKKVYENFLNIYCLITMISLLVWCLYLFDMAPMLGTISPLNELKQYNYNVYPFLVCASNSPRFCSVFDEPGVVGTISGILLCCQKFKLKDIRTIILLITGLCSTSMFFYILCAIYIVLYYLMVEKKLQGVILSIIIIIASLYIIQSNTILNEAIGYRFQWDSETGKMVGDNRTDELVLYYFTMLFGSKEFWLGLNNASLFLEYMEGECNIYMTILVNGAVLCLLYLCFMIIYGLTYKQKTVTFILFIVVFVATVYQRPFLFGAEFIFLWTYLAKLDKM